MQNNYIFDYINNFNNSIIKKFYTINFISKTAILSAGCYIVYKKPELKKPIIQTIGISTIAEFLSIKIGDFIEKKYKGSLVPYITFANNILLINYLKQLPLVNNISIISLYNPCLNFVQITNRLIGTAYYSSYILGMVFQTIFSRQIIAVTCVIDYIHDFFHKNSLTIHNYLINSNINDIIHKFELISNGFVKIIENNINDIESIIKKINNGERVIDLSIGDFKISSKNLVNNINVPVNIDLISPVYNLTNSCNLDHFKDKDCSICHETYDENRQLYRVLPCLHSFHVNCIDEWFERPTHRDCPICRKPVE